jgi:hypothetical protein
MVDLHYGEQPSLPDSTALLAKTVLRQQLACCLSTAGRLQEDLGVLPADKL